MHKEKYISRQIVCTKSNPSEQFKTEQEITSVGSKKLIYLIFTFFRRDKIRLYFVTFKFTVIGVLELPIKISWSL